MQRTPLLAVILAAVLPLAACGDDQNAASADDAGTTVNTAVGPATCAEADGSSPKYGQFEGGPPMCLQDGSTYRALIETNYGTLHVDLRADIAPVTVNSFVNLARFHYFDGTTCHRAIQGFVVQCGDPTGTGRGGPGYEFDDELDQIEPYQIGSLAMANAGPNTNGSQWFIITGDDGAMLPANYTLFGQVIDDDMNLVYQLDSVANPQDGPPLQPIDIISISIDER